jgi:hypothetical protein
VEIEANKADPTWAIVDNIMVYDGCIFMPASSNLWAWVLERTHGMGHEGVQKML